MACPARRLIREGIPSLLRPSAAHRARQAVDAAATRQDAGPNPKTRSPGAGSTCGAAGLIGLSYSPSNAPELNRRLPEGPTRPAAARIPSSFVQDPKPSPPPIHAIPSSGGSEHHRGSDSNWSSCCVAKGRHRKGRRASAATATTSRRSRRSRRSQSDRAASRQRVVFQCRCSGGPGRDRGYSERSWTAS